MGLGLNAHEQAEGLIFIGIRDTNIHPGDLEQVARIKELDTVHILASGENCVKGAGGGVGGNISGVFAVD